MNKEHSMEKGFTLIEVVASLVISGLFLTSLGMMIAYTLNSYNISARTSTLMADSTYWSKKLRYELRMATTPPFISSEATTGPVEVDAGGTYIRYQTFRTDLNKFVLNKIRLSGTNVKREMWYSIKPFNPLKNVYYNATRAPDATENMLGNASNLQFLNLAPNGFGHFRGLNATVTTPLKPNDSTVIKYRNQQ